MRRRRKEPKTEWEFLWWNEEETESPDSGDEGMRRRYYRNCTLLQACDKMVRFINRRRYHKYVRVDQEAKALHLEYGKVPHGEFYPDLSKLNHDIAQFV